MMATRKCAHCGGVLQEGVHGNQVFCSGACNRAYYGRQHDPNAKQECDFCGEEYTGRKRKYCSSECKNAADIERKKAKRPNGGIKERRAELEANAPEGFFLCRSCYQYMSEEQGVRKKAGRLELCKPCKREDRRKQAERDGKSYVPRSNRAPSRGKEEKLAERDAKQAWCHWLKSLAPGWWLDSYYEASGEPWRDHRLTGAEKWRVQYERDPEYRAREKERYRERKTRRRAHLQLADDGTVEERDIRHERSDCPYCGVELGAKNRTIDHLDPISLGGVHSASNLVPCCRSCNSSKSAKPFGQWLDELGPERRSKVDALYRNKRGRSPRQLGLVGM